MANQSFNLIPSAHRQVFRVLVDAIRKDSTLSRVVKTWSVMDGSPIDTQDFVVAHTPAIRLIPSEGPDQFYGPGGMIGPLVVLVEICMRGSDFDDPMDLYAAVRRAIYPKADAERLRIHQALVAAGAEAMFLTEFAQGSYAPRVMVDGPLIDATGQIQVRIRQDLNP